VILHQNLEKEIREDKKFLALPALIALSLAGCMSAEEQRAANLAQDRQQCTDYGFTPGSNAFANCMMTSSMHRDNLQQRQRALQAAQPPAVQATPIAAINYNFNDSNSTSAVTSHLTSVTHIMTNHPMVEPSEPGAPQEQGERLEPAESTPQAEPTEPAEPPEQVERSEPVEQPPEADPSLPAEATPEAEPSEAPSAESSEPSEPSP
jgi:hypothetical protein